MLNKIPEEYLATLVELLAETNALWTPCRFHNHERGVIVAVHQARRLYRDRGLSRVAGGSEATRQAQHRHRKAMQRAGLIVTAGRARGTCVKLTDAGEWAARGLVAATTIDSAASWALLRLVAALNTRPALENDLIGQREGATSRQLVSLELIAEPLLVCGWLDSNSDIQGHVGYFISEAGRKAAAGKRPEPPAEYPMLNEEASTRYDAAFADALNEIHGWKPSDRNEIVIPLGCGSWGEPNWTPEAKALQAEVRAAVDAPEPPSTKEGKANG